jgi:hypothetical protein
MKTRTAACAALLALTATLTACSSGSDSKADPASCKTAMRKQLRDSIAAGDKATPGTRPPQCTGVDDKTLEKYAGDLMTEQLGDAIESALPDPTETSDVTPECRAWIENELQDSSDSVEGTAGYDACGYLSKDELDQAIEDVTNSLLTATPTP